MQTPGSANIRATIQRGLQLLRDEPRLAAQQARQVLALYPQNPDALRLLGAAERQLGDDTAANQAELAAIRHSVRVPQLRQANALIKAGDLAGADQLLRQWLGRRPGDVKAIGMLAELAMRRERFAEAEALLRRALALAPGYTPARLVLVGALDKQNKPAAALAELELLPAEAAGRDDALLLRARALTRVNDNEAAIRIYRQMLAADGDRPNLWMLLGHMLKAVGRSDEAVAAYRRGLALAPRSGTIWWSLANLKTLALSAADIAAMEAALADPQVEPEERFHLHFALGKAHEDRGEAEPAFRHYAQGNAIRRPLIKHDAASYTRHVEACEQLFTQSFFAARRGQGCPARDPIFILGMPRSGSTLVEQILASHPAIEGTAELPDMLAIARRLGTDSGQAGGGLNYLDRLDRLDGDEIGRLGEEYIERTRIYRRTGRPLFIDKMPNNWLHVGLIRTVLPNARIIDARRNPLDCCLSNFKQHYASGQHFSYSLEEMGKYYRDYIRLMDHFDRVQPGAVHRLVNERLIDDLEGEVRRLLAYLGLAFDPACLAFHDNPRAVRSASAEQVRRPINRDGVGKWRIFEPWLDQLKQALGPALDQWDAPRGTAG